MKKPSLHLLFASSILFGSVHAQTITPKPRPSHADLIKKRKDNQPKITEQETNQKIVKPAKKSLIGSSTLISDGRNWTLLPKGSVVHIPEMHKKKIVSKPVGKLMEWKKFLTRNGSWIQTYPVEMKQAQGKESLNKEKFLRFQKLNKIVVATCASGPISVSKDAFPKDETQKK